MSAAVSLHGVTVEAGGRTLLQVADFRLTAGEHVALVGPNGAGKSTLLRLIGGQVAAASGRVTVLGRDVADAAPLQVRRQHRREVGLLSQGLHPVPRLTARENVLIGALARLQGLDAWRSWWRRYPPALVTEADQALAAVGLAEQAGVRSDRLSGGERQKVALARLQLQQPQLVLADEPTSALDPAATRHVCAALRSLAGGGRSLLTVVHDLALLPLLADRVVGMSGGRIRWDLPRAALGHEHLAALYDPASADAVVTGPMPASPSVSASASASVPAARAPGSVHAGLLSQAGTG
ncbi:ATP-binding cassette domain-containing protein [Rubrivivax albus]|uniref:ATP-binding cassette domain-containing protein n=2 Tax=Rubrivivax albus TaxID=2499835 RepID=A0A3S2TKC5_9BURK|nr:ATP-binding cassette domain-containing protein [Rubrivivax albus]